MAQKKQQQKKDQQPPVEVRELMVRKKLESLCTIRAWTDAGFRKALLADPKGTLQKVLNLKLPATTRVTIVEEKANEIYVSLPVKPTSEGELSDDQLEAVAGGRGEAVTRFCDDWWNESRANMEGNFSGATNPQNWFPGW